MRTLFSLATVCIAAPLAIASVLTWALCCHYDDRPVDFGDY